MAYPKMRYMLLATLVAGCGPSGPKTYPVSGTIKFNGEAMPDGYVVFTGGDSKIPPATGQIENGQYSLRATAGTHRVEVQASRFIGPENPIMGLRAKEQYVPDRYNLESILTAEVTPDGDNSFPFDLTDAPAEPASDETTQAEQP